jgi:hypothetical protein
MCERMRVLAGVLGCALALSLTACGGSSDGPTNTPVVVTPPPTPPPPRVVAQGNGFPLEAEFAGRVPFTTSLAGSLRATVDWTLAANDIDVMLVRGDCSFDQAETGQCPILVFSLSTTAKPETIQVDGMAAGAYTLFVENTGPGDESVSFQVVLTPSATSATPPAASSRGRQAMPLGQKRPSRGQVELR